MACDERARCCSDCGVRSRRPHPWVRTRPQNLPVAGRPTGLTRTKRRWRCVNEVEALAAALPALLHLAELESHVREESDR
ncbi:transposase family protein [Streptomyces sp. NPDC057966]|uniref:transposase family protein n=1 Tax=Streptomyces sp. NPDC057966 TaxID=3346292 RepID=UPI0036E2A8DC